MAIKAILENFKEIQTSILSFIEKEDDNEENFQNLQHQIEEQEIRNNSYKLTLLLHLIAKIADNHFHETDFYPKIERILLLLKDDIKGKCQDSGIFSIFKNNKKILLFLLEEKILEINKYIATKMQSGKYKKEKYPQYFYPEIKPYIKRKKEKKDTYAKDLQEVTKKLYPQNDLMSLLFMQGALEKRKNNDKGNKDEDNWISEFSNRLPDKFYENRKIGENESKICDLIRHDSIDSFISYVNQTSYRLDSTIPQSNYETNPFLLKKSKTTLIEYAAFYGSNQIFKYLFNNGAKLTPSLWEYAAHSNNSEMIRLIEENKVIPDSYSQVFNELIKCHHNEIANYIKNNYLDKENQPNNNDTNEEKEKEKEKEKEEEDSLSSSLKSYNFAFLQEETIDHSSFFYLCKYDYCLIVEQLINQENVDVNATIEKDVEYGYHEKFTETKAILHTAIERGNIDILKLLLTNEKLNANIMKKYITKSPHPDREVDYMVTMLKGNEWDPWDEWPDENYDIFVEMSPLYLAVEDENIEIIKILLQYKNLDVNLLSKFSMENPEENRKLMSPLHAAVENESLEIIQLLLENESIDANVISTELSNNPDGNGKHIKRRERTALAIAVENESYETVKLLVSSEKVDPNLPRVYFSYKDEHEEWSSQIDEKERPPLHIAIHNENIEIFRLLLSSKRIDPNHPQIETKSDFYANDSEEWDERRAPDEDPTFESSYLWGDVSKSWISSLKETKNEKTPLYFAIESKNNRFVQLLLGNEKIDINLRSKLVSTDASEGDPIEDKVEEKTALNFAIENDNFEVVRLLLQNGKIDINFPSKLSTIPREEDDDDEENEEEEEEKEKKKPQEEEITPLQIATKKGNGQIINLIKNYKK